MTDKDLEATKAEIAAWRAEVIAEDASEEPDPLADDDPEAFEIGTVAAIDRLVAEGREDALRFGCQTVSLFDPTEDEFALAVMAARRSGPDVAIHLADMRHRLYAAKTPVVITYGPRPNMETLHEFWNRD